MLYSAGYKGEGGRARSAKMRSLISPSTNRRFENLNNYFHEVGDRLQTQKFKKFKKLFKHGVPKTYLTHVERPPEQKLTA